jgi:hypothetical protein
VIHIKKPVYCETNICAKKVFLVTKSQNSDQPNTGFDQPDRFIVKQIYAPKSVSGDQITVTLTNQTRVLTNQT